MRYLIVVTLIVVFTAALATSGISQAAERPRTGGDGNVAIAGTVTSVERGFYTIEYGGAFTLDYGKGTVLVEMEDWNAPGETPTSMVGEQVTVFGDIVDDNRIRAKAIYIGSLAERFAAHQVDAEGVYRTHRRPGSARQGRAIGTTGTVESVGAKWFTLDTGERILWVSTEGLGSDVFDDRGLQRVDEGDTVTVYGEEGADRSRFQATSMIVHIEGPDRP